ELFVRVHLALEDVVSNASFGDLVHDLHLTPDGVPKVLLPGQSSPVVINDILSQGLLISIERFPQRIHLSFELKSFGIIGLDDCGKLDRKSTRLNSSHGSISYAVFCLK